MHAWIVNEYGHYREVMEWGETEEPTAGPTDAKIRVRAIGLNFPDILSIAGQYQVREPLPFVPGMECMGEVVEAGAESKFKPGDRIMTMPGAGAFGEFVNAPSLTSYRVPDKMSDEDAAAFQMIYQTSWFALRIRAHLQAGETLLVHGGAGGVGTAAIQLGKHLGATVIATAGSPEKLDVCRRCGADHVVNYTSDDFVETVKELTGGKGADVIFDPVGGDVFDLSTKCIAWNGRLLVIGFAGGRIPEIRANRILLKNMSVVGLYWGNYRLHEPHLVHEAQETLYGLYEQGAIKPVIYHTYPLTELPEALGALESRKAFGKVIVAPQ